jgi:hypothetical protein
VASGKKSFEKLNFFKEGRFYEGFKSFIVVNLHNADGCQPGLRGGNRTQSDIYLAQR